MEIYVMFPVQPKEPKLVQQQKIFICLYNSQKKDQVTKVTFGDTRIADEIMKSRSALEHKRLGRMVRKFDKTVWSTKSIDVVSKGNMLKFMQNRHLKETLLSTHPKILAEASHCDKKWGIGLPIHDSRIHDKECWVGENLLGRILTSVRQNMMNVSTKRKMNCPDGSAEVALPKQLDPNAHRFRACLRENDTFVTVTDYDGGIDEALEETKVKIKEIINQHVQCCETEAKERAANLPEEQDLARDVAKIVDAKNQETMSTVVALIARTVKETLAQHTASN